MTYRFKEGCNECPPYGFDHDPCGRHFTVEIHWPGDPNVDLDLDTGVSFTTDGGATEKTSGYDCDDNGGAGAANPKFKSADQTAGVDLVESHHISVTPGIGGDISVFIHWYVSVGSTAPANQPIKIYIKDGVREELCETTTQKIASGCSCDVDSNGNLIGELKVSVDIDPDMTWTYTCS